MRSGVLYEHLAFDEPLAESDGQGGAVKNWQEKCQVWANYRFLRGGETVQAARLAGKQPVVITIRADSHTRQITTDWRARDLRSGDIYNIRAIVPTNDRAFLEITAERGVAV